jgi:hypothetical protein
MVNITFSFIEYSPCGIGVAAGLLAKYRMVGNPEVETTQIVIAGPECGRSI